jgi:hypothetical protein
MMDHDEIQEIMGQSYGMDDVDEDDLEAGAHSSLTSHNSASLYVLVLLPLTTPSCRSTGIICRV